MLETLKTLFGIGPKTDFSRLMKNGAIIIDVRTKGEFDGGHIPGSMNIPLDQLQHNLNRLRNKSQPIITCCASGMRSASARALLVAGGYSEVLEVRLCTLHEKN